jgi:hypothetical protein
VWASLALLGLGLMGCGDEQMTMGTVSGVVTVGGKPLQSGIIHFVPEAGPAASGALDEEGRYELTTADSGDGAVVGKHRVFLTPMQDDAHLVEYTDADYQAGKIPPEPESHDFLPPQYLAPTTSGLTAEVVAGSNDLDFPLPAK